MGGDGFTAGNDGNVYAGERRATRALCGDRVRGAQFLMPNTTKQSVWTSRFLIVTGLVWSGCGQQAPEQKPEPQAEAKPATPPAPANLQAAATALPGPDD